MERIRKTLLIITVFFIITAISAGCNSQAIDKVFTVEDLHITLTTDFSEEKLDSTEACFKGKSTLIIAEKFEYGKEISSDSSLEDFAEYFIEYNSLDAERNKLQDFKNRDGYIYTSYVNEINGGNYKYFAYLYKSDNAFWAVYFCCSEIQAASCEKDIEKWAASVTFNT